MNYNCTIPETWFIFEKKPSLLAKTKLDEILLKKQKKPNASEKNSTTAKLTNKKSYSVLIFLINKTF